VIANPARYPTLNNLPLVEDRLKVVLSTAAHLSLSTQDRPYEDLIQRARQNREPIPRTAQDEPNYTAILPDKFFQVLRAYEREIDSYLLPEDRGDISNALESSEPPATKIKAIFAAIKKAWIRSHFANYENIKARIQKLIRYPNHEASQIYRVIFKYLDYLDYQR
jgi:hypothetical protein